MGGYSVIGSLSPDLVFYSLLHSTGFIIVEICHDRFEIKRTPLAASAYWLIVAPRGVTQYDLVRPGGAMARLYDRHA